MAYYAQWLAHGPARAVTLRTMLRTNEIQGGSLFNQELTEIELRIIFVPLRVVSVLEDGWGCGAVYPPRSRASHPHRYF